MSFEYNYLQPSLVEDATIIERSSDEYQEFLGDVRGGKTDGQRERERIIEEHPEAVQDFADSVQEIIEEPKTRADWIVGNTTLTGTSSSRIKNRWEVLRDLLEDNDPSPKAKPIEYRGECCHARNDDYKPNDPAAKCCWECSPGRRPKKFKARDEPLAQCSGGMRSYQLENAVVEDIDLQYFAKPIQDEYSIYDLKRIIAGLQSDDGTEVRKAAIKWAYMTHMAEIEEYNYQRAEAFLRDIDAPDAESHSTGEGGRRFEQKVRRMVERYEFPQYPRVLRCSIDPDVAERGHGPNTPVRYKEMDIHTELRGEPAIIEVFTQRSQKEKRRQLRNYAELYKLATGTEPRTLLLTDTATCTLTLGLFESLAAAREREAAERGRREVGA